MASYTARALQRPAVKMAVQTLLFGTDAHCYWLFCIVILKVLSGSYIWLWSLTALCLTVDSCIMTFYVISHPYIQALLHHEWMHLIYCDLSVCSGIMASVCRRVYPLYTSWNVLKPLDILPFHTLRTRHDCHTLNNLTSSVMVSSILAQSLLIKYECESYHQYLQPHIICYVKVSE